VGLDNKGDAVFRIKPASELVNAVDFQNIISLNCTSSVSVSRIQYSDGFLTVTFDYSDQSLLDSSLGISFDFSNSKYFKSVSSSFMITTENMTPPLVYESENLSMR
jgi:hypothetical protein